MTVYWTLAEVGESPAKLAPQNVRDRSLEPDDWLVFRTRTDVALSELTNAVVMAEEDLAPMREVVELHAVPNSEAAAFSGKGVFVKAHSTVSRTPLLAWLESLSESDVGAEKAAANQQLEMYRQLREAFDEVP